MEQKGDVGEGIVDEGADVAEEAWEKTESTEERMLEVSEDVEWWLMRRISWPIIESVKKVTYSM